MNKTENSEDRRRRKRVGNGGKGRENGGKGRTLKIEVQILPETCPQGVIKLQSNWPNGDVRQRLKCATMNTYLLYCRVCFLHCCSGGVYYIGKSWEILSSMCGCLSGVWSLVVSFATAKVAMGSPIAFVNSCVWDVFCFPEAFLTHQRQKATHAALLFCLGGLRHFLLPLVFLYVCLCLCCMCSCQTVFIWFSSCDVSMSWSHCRSSKLDTACAAQQHITVARLSSLGAKGMAPDLQGQGENPGSRPWEKHEENHRFVVYIWKIWYAIYKNYDCHKNIYLYTYDYKIWYSVYLLGGFDPGWHGMEFLMCFSGMEVDP